MFNTTVKNAGEFNKITYRPIRSPWLISFTISLLFSAFFLGCMKDEDIVPALTDDESLENRGGLEKVRAAYEVTNLVADVAEYDPVRIDTNLVNAWGIAIGPTGAFWISAAEKELSVIYDDEGNQLRVPVTMEGEPTGQVFNNSTGFVIPMVGVSRFIFVTEYGTITAWRTGNVATTMIDNSASGAQYTGVEIANDGTGTFLYVANVANGTIEVYDENWNLVNSKPFSDPSLPAGASPFNVQLVFGNLFVTYVGPGGGFVNIFNTNGMLLKRFAEGGTLNAPWGITNTPPEFGLGQSILIGNFGDGRINVYNKNGNFRGQLGDEDHEPISIDGLWALEFTAGAFAGTSDPDLYFTAGPDGEEHGIYGEIEHIEEEEVDTAGLPVSDKMK